MAGQVTGDCGNDKQPVLDQVGVVVVVGGKLLEPSQVAELPLAVVVGGALDPVHPEEGEEKMGDIGYRPAQVLVCAALPIHDIGGNCYVEEKDENRIGQENPPGRHPTGVVVSL